MRHLNVFFLTTICASVLILSAQSSVASETDGALSNSSAIRAGLVVEWYSQVEIGVVGEIVDYAMTVDENQTTTLFDISYGGKSERIYETDLDAFGEILGINGAEEKANLRKEVLEAELAARGISDVTISINKVTLPKSTLFVVNSASGISALDGESGRLLWSNSVGNPRYPTSGIGASAGAYVEVDDQSVYQSGRVAVVNGSTIYCLDASTGKVLWSRSANGVPSASPAVSDQFIFVPLYSGRLEVFPLDNSGIGTEFFVSTGKSTARPLLTDNTVSWPTGTGRFTVAPVEEVGSPKFRLRASDAIYGSGEYHEGRIFVASHDGFVYGIDEDRGALMWEFSTGQRITQTPMALGDALYVITTENELFKIDASDGRMNQAWEAPIQGITKFVGASQSKLYALDTRGRLNLIDLESGDRLGFLPSAPLDLVIRNSITDRLYVGSRDGFIQCLREVGNQFPHFHAGQDVGPEGRGDIDDPFKTDTDPAQPMRDEDDPFKSDKADDPFKSGDDDDPFKSGGDNNDPFKSGGSNDPFKPGGGG